MSRLLVDTRRARQQVYNIGNLTRRKSESRTLSIVVALSRPLPLSRFVLQPPKLDDALFMTHESLSKITSSGRLARRVPFTPVLSH